ncbi:hypothetical protein S245_022006 [Arachis hypogaea]
MHFNHFSQVWGLKKRVMLFVFFTLLLLFSQNNTRVLGHTNNINYSEKQNHQRQRQQQQHNNNLPRQLFDVNFSEKRKVPNASDPLHNR